MKSFQSLFPYSLALTSRILVTDLRRKTSLLKYTFMCSIKENNEDTQFLEIQYAHKFNERNFEGNDIACATSGQTINAKKNIFLHVSLTNF